MDVFVGLCRLVAISSRADGCWLSSLRNIAFTCIFRSGRAGRGPLLHCPDNWSARSSCCLGDPARIRRCSGQFPGKRERAVSRWEWGWQGRCKVFPQWARNNLDVSFSEYGPSMCIKRVRSGCCWLLHSVIVAAYFLCLLALKIWTGQGAVGAQGPGAKFFQGALASGSGKSSRAHRARSSAEAGALCGAVWPVRIERPEGRTTFGPIRRVEPTDCEL